MSLSHSFPIISCLVCIGLITAAPTADDDDGTLVLLHVLFRHGNRAPDQASIYPNDIHKNETYWPVGFSQLTTKGKRTEYEIGKYIRQTYNDFIPLQYTPNMASVLTTNFKRTKMSAELVLASLFPPTLKDVFPGGPLLWQPISFNIEQAGGLIGVPQAYCNAWTLRYYSYLLSDEAKAIVEPYQEFFKTLSQIGGYPVHLPRDIGNLYFTLKSEEDFGLSLPAWASGVYPEKLEETYAIDYEFSTANSALKKFTSGFLLKKILQDTQAKISGILPDERKIFIYSAHEFNVATMLRTLNVFYRHIPPFGATIYFEIRKIQNVYGLKLFYQDYKDKSGMPKLLTIPNCGSFCPLDKLQQLVQDSLPTEQDICEPSTELL